MDHNTQEFVKAVIELAIRDTLRHCDLAYLRQLEAIKHQLHKIIMTQQELATALNGLAGQVGTIATGITDLLNQAGQASPDAVTALGNLTTAVNAAQALLPTPPAPAPAPTPAPTTP